MMPIGGNMLGGPARPMNFGQAPTRMPVGTPGRRSFPTSFKKGGKVIRGGIAKLHKGERVVKARKFANAKSVLGGKKKPYPKGPKAKAKVEKTMHEWGQGTLHSGSKKGPKVTNQKQAVAIALSQARKAK
jgi:Family of unknown function (DUF6496)